MHTLSTSFILGYHGCDAAVAEDLLEGKNFKPSQNDYDWLGHGVYFWEANPRRGFQFSEELKERGKKGIKTPAVVGAIIELGYCLDLTTTNAIDQIKTTYDLYEQETKAADVKMPVNSGGDDLLLRKLDCAVINHLHVLREVLGEQPFDTVKGVFIEGVPIYEGAGIFEKTHIQVCVRKLDFIKGVFRVPARFL